MYKRQKQLCDALSYLHSQKPPIIYRDMKPANVMLKPEGNIKIIDFGIAREYKEQNLADTTVPVSYTHLDVYKRQEHRGVLTGSALTDVKVTILTGRAHVKHTEGGDFRQATYRAIRQGLKRCV